MKEPDSGNEGSAARDWLVALLLTQATALIIAMVTPLTPSKTGSTWTPADLFFTDPSYVEEVFVSFVSVNLLMAVLALVAWIAIQRDRPE